MKINLILLLFFLLESSALFAQTYNLTWTKRTDLTGLPSEITVYSTTSELNGRAFSAWYAIADMSDGNIEMRALYSETRKTPSSFVSSYGSGAYICTNGGYFDTSSSTSSSYSVVIDQSSVKANNIASVTRSGQAYYPTRGALGVDSDQNGTCGWCYSLNGVPWIYPTPSPNVEGETPQEQPSSSFPQGGEQWDAYSAIGGGPLLIKDGVNQIDYSTNYELLQSDVYGSGVKAPRTAIGYTSDSKMILFVCDGRQTSSLGATIDEVAQLMLELGCTNALNLDGGGSSAMIADGTCLNSPSDGSERAVASAVMFAKKEDSTTSFSMKELWNFSETSAVTPDPDWTFTSTNARTIATDGTYVYIPVRGGALEDGVRVIDPDKGEFIQNLSMNGISGGTHIISCVEVTDDGKILVSNLTTDVSSSPFKIYMYDSSDLNADPSVLLSFSGTSETGTATARFGDTFTFEGTIEDGEIRAASNGISGKYFVWIVKNGSIEDNEPTVTYLYNADGSSFTTALGGYPRVYPAGTDSVWIKGAGYRPRLFVENKYVGTVGSCLENNYGNTSLPFSYKGKRYLACVDYAGTTSGYGNNAEGVIIDVTDSPEGEEVCRMSTNLGSTGNINQTDGTAVSVSDDGFKVFFLCATEGTAAYSVEEADNDDDDDDGGNTTNVSTLINNQIKVYPNPAHETVYFSENMKEVKLFSISGKILKKNTNCDHLSLTGLSGFYLIQLIDDSGTISTQKLIAY